MLLITHNGTFHLDEVISTAILKILYPTARIKRTRNMDEINQGDIVYDVGSIYDPAKLRFDHHQRGFNDKIINVKLSSSGLIYRHYFKDLFKMFNITPSNKFFNLIYYEIYDEYFKYADAIDNGIDIENIIRQENIDDEAIEQKCENGGSNQDYNDKEFIYNILSISSGCVSKCRVRTLGNIVSSLNSSKNGFKKAVKLVKKDLKRYLENKLGFWAYELEKAEKVFKTHFENIKDDRKFIDNNLREVNLHQKVLVLEEKDHCSMDVLFILNAYYKKDICFIIYKSEKDCRIYAMRVSRFSFVTKVPLKEEWRGINSEKLQELSGIEDAIFVHATGFTGGAKGLESALKMCELSLMERK